MPDTTSKATKATAKKPSTTVAKPAKAAAKTVAKKTPAKTPAIKPVAATKPAVKKLAVKTAAKTAVKPKAPRKNPAKAAPLEPSKTLIVSDEQRYRMVAEAAYYRAESNQFKSDPLRDWIEAENDIATLLSGASK